MIFPLRFGQKQQFSVKWLIFFVHVTLKHFDTQLYSHYNGLLVSDVENALNSEACFTGMVCAAFTTNCQKLSTRLPVPTFCVFIFHTVC